jgi:hypothetical protein
MNRENSSRLGTDPLFEIGEIRLAIAVDPIKIYLCTIGQHRLNRRRAEKRGEENHVSWNKTESSQAVIKGCSRLIKKELSKMSLSPSRVYLMSKESQELAAEDRVLAHAELWWLR